MTTQEVRDQRASAWAEMQNLMSEASDRVMTAEEQQRFDKFEKDIEALSSDIAKRDKFESHKAEFAEVRLQPAAVETAIARVDTDTDEQRHGKAFSSWLRHGLSGLDPEQRSLMGSSFESRAQGTTTTAGGYLVPALFRQQIILALKAFGGVREASEVIETDSGASLPWPTFDDTANVGAILAENTQVTEQDAAFGTASLDVYMYTSKLVRVSLQLINDSGFDIDGWLPAALGERLARIQNQHFTTGTGTAQPEGIQTNATIGATGLTGTTTSVTFDSLIDLIASVDPAYRNERSAFMLRDAALASVRKIKDSQNRPLWEPSMQGGTPDRVLGYPVLINQDMPAMAANAKSILFGDFKAAYVIRDVLGIQQLRLEERYADFLQVGFLAFLRTGARPQRAGAIRAYANSAT